MLWRPGDLSRDASLSRRCENPVRRGVALLLGSRSSSTTAGLRVTAAGGLTAVTIAAYTLWDGYTVRIPRVDVVAYLAIGSAAQLLVLSLGVAPGVLSFLPWRAYWRSTLPVAVLVPTQLRARSRRSALPQVQTVAALRSTSIIAAPPADGCSTNAVTPERIAGAIITRLELPSSPSEHETQPLEPVVAAR